MKNPEDRYTDHDEFMGKLKLPKRRKSFRAAVAGIYALLSWFIPTSLPIPSTGVDSC